MGWVVNNVNFSVRLSLTVLKFAGFWPPECLTHTQILLYYSYGFFSFMFVLGTYIIGQVVDLFQVWGDLPTMTVTALLLFTNLAHFTKIVNLVVRRALIRNIIEDAHEDLVSEATDAGKRIVKRCNLETKFLQLLYYFITGITLIGWSTSPEEGNFPIRSWYPFDASKSPVYSLVYAHQVCAVMVLGWLNVAKDSLVATLVAQCRCRLQLLSLQLRTICHDIPVPDDKLLSLEEEDLVLERLRACVCRHQAALASAAQLHQAFSEPTFAQFTVSLIIICVTAFQMVIEPGNMAVESVEISRAVYAVPWYACRGRVRRSLTLMSERCTRAVRLTIGGFTELSLDTFTNIIKTSYSMFTLLQQVVERN